MKFRVPPKSIPIWTWDNSKRYMRDSVRNSVVVEIMLAALSCLVLFPAYLWYFIENLGVALWHVLRYCTYSLNDKEEAAVQKVIKDKEATND